MNCDPRRGDDVRRAFGGRMRGSARAFGKTGFWVLAGLALTVGAFLMWRLRHPVYDVVIEWGRVYDGERMLPFGSGVAVRQGLVSRTGFVFGLRAKRRINAWGKVVSPGFIDTHAHVEASVAPGRPFRAPNFVQMGVTTVITGNCGTSAADIDGFLQGLEKAGGHVNLATLAGHNTIRQLVLGRKLNPSEADLESMAERLEKALEAGAFGLSSGLEYHPGIHATEAELVRLARVAARRDRIYVTHLRNEGVECESALDEALRTAKAAGVRLHVSHLKIAAPSSWERMGAVLEKLQAARRAGLPISQDVYLYGASSTSLDIVLPEQHRNLAAVRPRLTDRRFREDLIRQMAARLARQGFPDCSHMVVAYASDPVFRGRTIPEISASISPLLRKEPWRMEKGDAPGISSELRLELETVLYLLWRGGAQMIYHAMKEENLEAILRDPFTMIGSDSSVRTRSTATSHPRGSGNCARLLAKYVREKGVLDLPEALRRLTSLPADTFRIHGRGRLRPGYAADIVIFDPVRVEDRATYEAPLEPPAGISHVLVNGVSVVEHGRLDSVFPGKPLRAGNQNQIGSRRIPSVRRTSTASD